MKNIIIHSPLIKNKSAIYKYYSNYNYTPKEMKNYFDGEISILIVAKEYRGNKIGNKLIITQFIKNNEYTIYKKIINLYDLMCTSVNITLEKRLIHIMVIRGVHENTVYHIKEAQKLKEDLIIC